ncbi:MAG: aldo/keto reductase [Aquisalimonadaceae bacterium]
MPDWAEEIDCQIWAQLFLKYLIAHPAVIAVIPATNNPEHAADNMTAGRGALPDQQLRERLVDAARG